MSTIDLYFCGYRNYSNYIQQAKGGMEVSNLRRNTTTVSLPPVTQSNVVNHEPSVLSAYNATFDFERNAETSSHASRKNSGLLDPPCSVH
jgi:uncharacterized protein YraI